MMQNLQLPHRTSTHSTTQPAKETHESYASIRNEGKNNLIHKLAKVN